MESNMETITDYALAASIGIALAMMLFFGLSA